MNIALVQQQCPSNGGSIECHGNSIGFSKSFLSTFASKADPHKFYFNPMHTMLDRIHLHCHTPPHCVSALVDRKSTLSRPSRRSSNKCGNLGAQPTRHNDIPSPRWNFASTATVILGSIEHRRALHHIIKIGEILLNGSQCFMYYSMIFLFLFLLLTSAVLASHQPYFNDGVRLLVSSHWMCVRQKITFSFYFRTSPAEPNIYVLWCGV